MMHPSHGLGVQDRISTCRPAMHDSVDLQVQARAWGSLRSISLQ